MKGSAVDCLILQGDYETDSKWRFGWQETCSCWKRERFWSMTAIRIREYSIDLFISSFNLHILTTRFIVILVEVWLVVTVENFIASLKCMTHFNVYEIKSYVAISILSFLRSRHLRSTSSLIFFTPAAYIKWILFIKIVSVICLRWCNAVLFHTVANMGAISRSLKNSDRILNLWLLCMCI
jgi:hypothetical protein